MGLRWQLAEVLAERNEDWDALAARLPFGLSDWMRGDELPDQIDTEMLAGLCRALACEPGELLGWVAENPEEQAARALAHNASYQSLMAFMQAREATEGEPEA